MLGLILSVVILNEAEGKVAILSGFYWPTYSPVISTAEISVVEIEFELKEEKVVWHAVESGWYLSRYSTFMSSNYYTFDHFVSDLKEAYSILQSGKLSKYWREYGGRIILKDLSYHVDDEYGKEYFGWTFSFINLGKKYEPKWQICLDLVIPTPDIYGRIRGESFVVYLDEKDIEKFLKKIEEK